MIRRHCYSDKPFIGTACQHNIWLFGARLMRPASARAALASVASAAAAGVTVCATNHAITAGGHDDAGRSASCSSSLSSAPSHRGGGRAGGGWSFLSSAASGSARPAACHEALPASQMRRDYDLDGESLHFASPQASSSSSSAHASLAARR